MQLIVLCVSRPSYQQLYQGVSCKVVCVSRLSYQHSSSIRVYPAQSMTRVISLMVLFSYQLIRISNDFSHHSLSQGDQLQGPPGYKKKTKQKTGSFINFAKRKQY